MRDHQAFSAHSSSANALISNASVVTLATEDDSKCALDEAAEGRRGPQRAIGASQSDERAAIRTNNTLVQAHYV